MMLIYSICLVQLWLDIWRKLTPSEKDITMQNNFFAEIMYYIALIFFFFSNAVPGIVKYSEKDSELRGTNHSKLKMLKLTSPNRHY